MGALAASGALAAATTAPARRVTSAAPARPVAIAANSSGMTVAFTFTQTNAGTQHGNTTTGVKGHGTFSAKVGEHAADLALLTAATGIPFDQIARGGSFAVDFTFGATGINTGTVMARFKTKRLGSVCLSFTAKPGHFHVGDSFVPTTGTIKVLGGTGAAARWNAGGSFSLKAIGGTGAMQKYTFSGTAHGTVTAKPHGLTAACKAA
jgi:hypothetical protein